MIIRKALLYYIRYQHSGYSFLLFLWISLFCSHTASAQQAYVLAGYDGPYILYHGNEAKRISVQNGKIDSQDFSNEPFEVITDDSSHRFQVPIHPIKIPTWEYKRHHDVLILSDPHGDFESFHSILKAHKVIGERYQWTFGKQHLVVIGDVFDRGDDVLPILWLIYKLEAEAHQVGGTVHFLLGNHEEMILRGNLKYAKDKYKELARQLGKDYRELWSMDTELGRWLLTRNTIEKIGDQLFVHAGLNIDIVDDKWSIPAVNDSIRAHIYHTKDERKHSAAAKFLFGSEGPLWYRGMVKNDEKYNPLSGNDLDRIMAQYAVKRIFVGHTIFPEVTSFYDGRIYAVNVNNKANREKRKSRGILIKGKKSYIIYDDPNKTQDEKCTTKTARKNKNYSLLFKTN